MSVNSNLSVRENFNASYFYFIKTRCNLLFHAKKFMMMIIITIRKMPREKRLLANKRNLCTA